MKKFLASTLIMFGGISSTYAGVFDSGKKYETIAIIAFYIIAGIGIITAYLVWKNKQKKSPTKYKIKTVTVNQNGRRMVYTKKYRILPPQG